MKRRCFLSLLGAGLLLPIRRALAWTWPSEVVPGETDLLGARLQLGGDWGGSTPADASVVIGSMRAGCLGGVALVSDAQPKRLRIDNKTGKNPSVWLHSGNSTTAWVTVIVGTRDWCNLAYQFGHELGHVLCNSWERNAKPRNPCQWLEEALAEAFTLRGLGRMADGWARSPPFPNDAAYATSIRDYRETLLAGYRTTALAQGMAAGFPAWFAAHDVFFETHGGLDDAKGAVSTMLGLLEDDADAVADLGALNRWPGRSGIPLPDYLDRWEESCAQLGAPNRLPGKIRALLANR